MKIFLVHGMGRTPLAMRLLGWRLKRGGMEPHYFGYCATFESFDACVVRLVRRIGGDEKFMLAGHSLGGVLCRAAMPHLPQQPEALFLIAAPSVACHWARQLKDNVFYRWLKRDMGQKLADPTFMAGLPIPACPALIFSGTKGPRWRWWPSGQAVNDGLLTREETQIAGIPARELSATHSLIMNHPAVTAEILAMVRKTE